MGFRSALAALLLCTMAGAAAEELAVCYNYGCGTHATVDLSDAQLARVNLLFAWVEDAEQERQAISQAIGLMQLFVGQQTPTFRDRARNLADEGVDGRMDCIDHSHNDTVYMNMMQAHGWFKFHRVLEPVRRTPFLFLEHWAARIAETGTGREYAVDSWFFDHGHAAAIFPLEDWKKGAEPDE